MSVYLDLAFCANFLFDAQIIVIAHLICSKKIRPLRVFFAALMGGVEGVLVFFPYFGILSLPPINAAVSVLMTAIAICPCRVRQFLRFYIVFMSASFFLAGFMTFLSAGALWGSLLILPTCLMLKRIKDEIFLKRADAVLYFNGKRVEKRALYDSGNCVFYLGKPVIFGNKKLFFDLFGKDSSEEELKTCEKMCVIPYKTVGKSGTVMGIRLDKAVVDGKCFDGAVLGFFEENLRDEIILNGTMM